MISQTVELIIQNYLAISAGVSASQISSFLSAQPANLLPDVRVALEGMADTLRLEDPQRALMITERLVDLANFMGDERARANALRLRANSLVVLNQYTQSIFAFREAKDILTRYGDTLEVARVQVGWTAALKNLARYDEALSLAIETRGLLIEKQRWDWLASLEMNIGSIYRLTDRYPEALAVYQSCQDHFKLAGNFIGVAQSQINTAHLLAWTDHFREAQDLLMQAQAVLAVNQKHLQVARVDLNLATLYAGIGRYQAAWETYDQAWAVFKRLDVKEEMAVVDLYSAQLYLSLNRYPEALERAKSARESFSTQGMERYTAIAAYTQAAALQALGQTAQALSLYQAAQIFFYNHQGNTWAAWIDLERASLLRQTKQLDEARSAAQRALETFIQSGLVIRQAQARLLLAECLSDAGQTGPARVEFRSAISSPLARRQAALIYRAQAGLGRLEEINHHPGTAYRHYRAAIRQIESIHRDLRVDEFKASFLDDKLDIYQAAVRLSLERGRLEEAFGYVERAKNSALLDLLARNLELRENEAVETVDQAIWERLRKLKEEWTWRYSRMEGPSSGELHNSRSSEVLQDKSWSELSQIEAQINRTIRKLQGGRYKSLASDKIYCWQSVLSNLEPGTLLIEYFALGDEILAFVVNGRDGSLKVCRSFPYTLREIKRSLRMLEISFKDLNNLDAGYVRGTLAPLAQRHLAWLYTALLAPLGDVLADAARLVIMPHDCLYNLPFHAFYDGYKYLMDQFEVAYAPSTGVLAYCYETRQKLPPADRPALVMSYSDHGRLAYVAGEARTVAGILGNANLYQEETATLANLRQQAGRCQLLHIASHAAFRRDNPLFSHILLADEPLNVIDFYHLALPAALVTLSACETGLNQLNGGDLFGLSRGCFYAGVPALVASLWQVNDASTAILMGEFYRRVKSGERFSRALQGAMQALRSFPGSSQDPYPYDYPQFWAPFCLIGADSTI